VPSLQATLRNCHEPQLQLHILHHEIAFVFPKSMAGAAHTCRHCCHALPSCLVCHCGIWFWMFRAFHTERHSWLFFSGCRERCGSWR
jgi:hypothetical protein